MSNSKQVLVFDTDMLCVWLKIPGMDSCGKADDPWRFQRIDDEIKAALEQGFTLVLPLASIIETGNHIAHANAHRLDRANQLAKIICKAADGETPWAVFHEPNKLWSPEHMKELAATWPPLAQNKLAIGDATIKKVGEYYASMGCEVLFLTGDKQLKAYQPPPPALIPRRRQN